MGDFRVSLDFNSTKTKRAAFSAGLAAALEAELARKQGLQGRRAYLGASAIGGECERAMQFELAGAPREREHKPETLRKFAFGHLSEEWARQEFLDAGFRLTQINQKTHLAFAFSQLDGQFKGHPDGVFIGGPEVEGLSYPALWEHKGVGSKTYRAVERDGLKKAKPGYYAQVAIYQGYLGLYQNDAVFTVTNLDTGEQLHELIPFDAEEAQRMTDRAVRIIQATNAEELLPRPFAEPTHYVCKGMCDFPARCWALPR